jgi:hypothetical protein
MPTLAEFIDKLRQAEQDPYLLELHQIDVFDDVLPALATVSAVELADLLLQWRQDYPAGSYLLLQAIAASPLAGQLAEAFARRLASWEEDPEYVDAILAAGISQFEPPVRDWLVERPGVRSRLGLGPLDENQRLGLDDRPLPEVPEPLPDVETVAGVQARLLLHELNCGPVTGTWNPRTQAALHRLQYECDHPQPGAVDAQTIEWLRSVEP